MLACSDAQRTCWRRSGGEFPDCNSPCTTSAHAIITCSEEQHDDQILYEVLRCFRALTMTNVRVSAFMTGALRQPLTPWQPLT